MSNEAPKTLTQQAYDANRRIGDVAYGYIRAMQRAEESGTAPPNIDDFVPNYRGTYGEWQKRRARDRLVAAAESVGMVWCPVLGTYRLPISAAADKATLAVHVRRAALAARRALKREMILAAKQAIADAKDPATRREARIFAKLLRASDIATWREVVAEEKQKKEKEQEKQGTPQ